MCLCSYINKQVSLLDINNSIKYTYLSLLLQYPPFQQFHLPKKDIQHQLNLKTRQFENHLFSLEKTDCLKRSYKTVKTIDRKSGRNLFVELTPPLGKTQDKILAVGKQGKSAAFTKIVKRAEEYYANRG
jgi:hypothetical protein